MKKLPIIEIPHEVLREKALEVHDITEEILELLDDMLYTMYQSKGVGLAANQVGILKRVIVLDCRDEDEKPNPYKMVNPVIIGKSQEKSICSEGCLSIPKEYADVERHNWVEVEYTDEHGKRLKIKAKGLLSIALQHEIDHLDGVMFIDYLSDFKRKRLLQHLSKKRKQKKG